MKHLILMRHARAEEASSDAARPLSPQGQEDALRMGPAIMALGPCFQPTRVLCSTARRARETWEGLRPVLPGAPTAELLDELYLAGAGRMLAQLQALPEEARAALLIAHEPGLSQLTRLLAARATAEVAARAGHGMSPGTIAAIRFEIDRWADLAPGSGELIDFRRPADLEPER